MKTIVCLSGGLDSTVVLAGIEGEKLALGFYYGQRHRIELTRAEAIAKYYDTPFKIIDLPAMPKVNDVVFAGRNMVFAAIAISFAAARVGYSAVAFGCNASDWARFPDCRPSFWRGIETSAEAYGIRVLTPLLHSSKRDIVEAARKLNVPIEMTWSCYDPQGPEPCGECLACKTRNEALAA